MLFLRLAGILVVLAIGAGIVAYLFTGQRKYLHHAFRIFKFALIFALIVLGLMAAERLAVMI
jgi:hypothetical protein